MKIQRIEEFFGEGSLGASGGKSLVDVITRMNKEGWMVDQVIPPSFRPDRYSEGGLNVSSGILLCSCVAR